jgi:hypothetical protein
MTRTTTVPPVPRAIWPSLESKIAACERCHEKRDATNGEIERAGDNNMVTVTGNHRKLNASRSNDSGTAELR